MSMCLIPADKQLSIPAVGATSTNEISHLLLDCDLVKTKTSGDPKPLRSVEVSDHPIYYVQVWFVAEFAVLVCNIEHASK